MIDPVTKTVGERLGHKVIEGIDGFPGDAAAKADIAGVVVATVTNYQVEQEEAAKKGGA